MPDTYFDNNWNTLNYNPIYSNNMSEGHFIHTKIPSTFLPKVSFRGIFAMLYTIIISKHQVPAYTLQEFSYV